MNLIALINTTVKLLKKVGLKNDVRAVFWRSGLDPTWQKLCLDKQYGGFLLGRISINNLMSTLTTNVEVYQPCRCTSVKPNINVYSTFKRQRFINYQ